MYYNPFCDPFLICGAIVDIDRVWDVDPEDWLPDLGVGLPSPRSSSIVMPKLTRLKSHTLSGEAGVEYLDALGVDVKTDISEVTTARLSITGASRTILPRVKLQTAVRRALSKHRSPRESELWSALTDEHNFIIHMHYTGVLNLEFESEADGQVDLGFKVGPALGVQGSVGWRATSEASVQTDCAVPFAFEALRFKAHRSRLVEVRGL